MSVPSRPAENQKEAHPNHCEDNADRTKNSLGRCDAREFLGDIHSFNGCIQRRGNALSILRRLEAGFHSRQVDVATRGQRSERVATMVPNTIKAFAGRPFCRVSRARIQFGQRYVSRLYPEGNLFPTSRPTSEEMFCTPCVGTYYVSLSFFALLSGFSVTCHHCSSQPTTRLPSVLRRHFHPNPRSL